MDRREHYRQKAIDILNSNFGEDYSIEWLDDTHFSLTCKEPVYNNAHEIVGKVMVFIPNCTLECYDNCSDGVYLLCHGEIVMRLERGNKNERSNSN